MKTAELKREILEAILRLRKAGCSRQDALARLALRLQDGHRQPIKVGLKRKH